MSCKCNSCGTTFSQYEQEFRNMDESESGVGRCPNCGTKDHTGNY